MYTGIILSINNNSFSFFFVYRIAYRDTHHARHNTNLFLLSSIFFSLCPLYYNLSTSCFLCTFFKNAFYKSFPFKVLYPFLILSNFHFFCSCHFCLLKTFASFASLASLALFFFGCGFAALRSLWLSFLLSFLCVLVS